MPNERLGEVGGAYVVAKQGVEISEAGLIAWCREQMANYKVSRRVLLFDALSTSASGKVEKYQLRERAGEGGRLGPCNREQDGGHLCQNPSNCLMLAERRWGAERAPSPLLLAARMRRSPSPSAYAPL